MNKVVKGYEPTEHQRMNAIEGYLWMKGYYVQRMNAGKMRVKAFKRDSVTGAMRSADRVVQMAAPGTPDLMAFKPGRPSEIAMGTPLYVELLFIEVKRPGNKPTPLQTAKMEELSRYGARCMVATGAEELQKAGI